MRKLNRKKSRYHLALDEYQDCAELSMVSGWFRGAGTVGCGGQGEACERAAGKHAASDQAGGGDAGGAGPGAAGQAGPGRGGPEPGGRLLPCPTMLGPPGCPHIVVLEIVMHVRPVMLSSMICIAQTSMQMTSADPA